MHASKLISAVSERLDARGERARQLRALVFDPMDRRDVIVFRRRNPRPFPYPSLSTVLAAVSRTCRKERIGVQQLKRIWFFRNRVNFEFDNRHGEHEVRSYWIADTGLRTDKLSHLMPALRPVRAGTRTHFRPGLTMNRGTTQAFKRIRNLMAALLVAIHQASANSCQIVELAAAA
jgi:hypothetical protein